jgi:hypothetical protein
VVYVSGVPDVSIADTIFAGGYFSNSALVVFSSAPFSSTLLQNVKFTGLVLTWPYHVVEVRSTVGSARGVLWSREGGDGE